VSIRIGDLRSKEKTSESVPKGDRDISGAPVGRPAMTAFGSRATLTSSHSNVYKMLLPTNREVITPGILDKARSGWITDA